MPKFAVKLSRTVRATTAEIHLEAESMEEVLEILRQDAASDFPELFSQTSEIDWTDVSQPCIDQIVNVDTNAALPPIALSYVTGEILEPEVLQEIFSEIPSITTDFYVGVTRH